MKTATHTGSSVSEPTEPSASHIFAQPSSATFNIQDELAAAHRMSCETSGSTGFENDPDLVAAIVSVVAAAKAEQTAKHDALTELRRGASSSTHVEMHPDIIEPPHYVCVDMLRVLRRTVHNVRQCINFRRIRQLDLQPPLLQTIRGHLSTSACSLRPLLLAPSLRQMK